ncbi:hypothetical protein QJQ45_018322 [Haematococcus lacustris]|nr:hypothetical protein QJQ45_018322 [Haematococcus lacustris]
MQYGWDWVLKHSNMPAAAGSDTVRAVQARQHVSDILAAVQSGSVAQFKKAGKRAGLKDITGLRDGEGRGCLHHACQAGYDTLAVHLLEKWGFRIDDQDIHGETPLALAAAAGRLDVMKMLLARGAQLGLRREPQGTTAVHRAACLPSCEALAMLLNAGAAVNTASATGTPLCWAASAGALDCLRLLLERGADPTSSDSRTALCMAVGSGSLACVNALLAAGADVGAASLGKATALHVAAAVGGEDGQVTQDIIQALIKAGADCNAHDEGGRPPIMLAGLARRPGAVAALLPHSDPVPGIEPWTQEGVMAAMAAQRAAAHQAGHQHSDSCGCHGHDHGHEPGPHHITVAVPDPEEPDDQQAALHKRKGDEAFVNQDFSAAAAAYSASLRHATHDAVVWANRAAAHLRLGNGRQALGDARTARTLDPKYPKAWYREGAAHQLLQDWEEAATTFYEGYSLFPANKEFEVAFKQAVEEGRKAHQAAKAAAAAAAGNECQEGCCHHHHHDHHHHH